MKITDLILTKQLHQVVFEYLFPGDSLEAAGVLLCNQGTGNQRQRLLATEFIALPHELSHRSRDYLNWPFEAYLDVDCISEIDQRKQSIVTIHSHPNGCKSFSEVDNANDKELFKSINGWFDDSRINGSRHLRC